ncbi:hypothetical protein PTSG_08582 [Salpingoeca rosetta]|uniref:Uncharacterized protein n=1 Tax=Salpingoeca rosetta (strain ATCC 50818 / BSB-021) TaxID=946362 RepID=F2UK36_SALR5|nr:uncharacterized protein PTSG_08582 [Salpingoeca rosetta]EGD77485.1 hypothetical protein PTSG_08582 [Salpingoeca rosetta]|eukprot:XP_004990373.1 hypothetical protein PTSG_08582 [Salpingoeca rosetta]
MTTAQMYSFHMDYDYLFKFIIVGDASTGKTSLISRYTHGVFPDTTVETVGVDFFFHQLNLEGSKLKVQIWDTAGQERFQSIIRSYYRGSHAVIYTYDVTDPDSFDNLSRRWFPDTEAHIAPGTLKVLVANKSDHHRALPNLIERGRALAEERDMPFCVVSAKTGSNVDRTFTTLAEDCLRAVQANKLSVRRRKPLDLSKKVPIKMPTKSSSIFSSWCSLL